MAKKDNGNNPKPTGKKAWKQSAKYRHGNPEKGQSKYAIKGRTPKGQESDKPLNITAPFRQSTLSSDFYDSGAGRFSSPPKAIPKASDLTSASKAMRTPSYHAAGAAATRVCGQLFEPVTDENFKTKPTFFTAERKGDEWHLTRHVGVSTEDGKFIGVKQETTVSCLYMSEEMVVAGLAQWDKSQNPLNRSSRANYILPHAREVNANSLNKAKPERRYREPVEHSPSYTAAFSAPSRPYIDPFAVTREMLRFEEPRHVYYDAPAYMKLITETFAAKNPQSFTLSGARISPVFDKEKYEDADIFLVAESAGRMWKITRYTGKVGADGKFEGETDSDYTFPCSKSEIQEGLQKWAEERMRVSEHRADAIKLFKDAEVVSIPEAVKAQEAKAASVYAEYDPSDRFEPKYLITPMYEGAGDSLTVLFGRKLIPMGKGANCFLIAEQDEGDMWRFYRCFKDADGFYIDNDSMTYNVKMNEAVNVMAAWGQAQDAKGLPKSYFEEDQDFKDLIYPSSFKKVRLVTDKTKVPDNTADMNARGDKPSLSFI